MGEITETTTELTLVRPDAPRYGISQEYSRRGNYWLIRDYSEGTAANYPGPIVWERAIAPGEDGTDAYPADLCAVYERLVGRPEFIPFDDPNESQKVNIVELIGEDGSAFDQTCRYGYRVDGHAVYCHNDGWLYAPRKCQRTWYTGGRVKDEDCRGFQAADTANRTEEERKNE